MTDNKGMIIQNYWSTALMSIVIEYAANDGQHCNYLFSAEALDAIYRDDAQQSYHDIFDKYREEILDISRRHIEAQQLKTA